MSELKPLHAINVFIEPWFREEIIENVLADFSVYSDDSRKELVETLKSEVKVHGFRNPLTAPKRLLVREADKLFETDPRFVKVILAAWVQLYDKNSKAIDKVLESLKFDLPETLPVYEDPINGFAEGWPAGVDYAAVVKAMRKVDETNEMTDDQIALYTILRTGFLPGERDEEE
ncbi:MAG: hypothetical protein GX603_06160 [Chloroflexi bacterium]|nr:hypothetical protein [Chloroflexota bacterium]